MNRRRFFLTAVSCVSAVASGKLGAIGKPVSASPSALAAAGIFVPGAGSYGSGVREKVFEVVVRQALAGAPWREICAGPMQVNQINPADVEAEVDRRQKLLHDHPYHVGDAPTCPACSKERIKAEREERMKNEHGEHKGYIAECPTCHTDWRGGRALRLREGEYEWID